MIVSWYLPVIFKVFIITNARIVPTQRVSSITSKSPLKVSLGYHVPRLVNPSDTNTVTKPTPSLYLASKSETIVASFTKQDIQPSSHIDIMSTTPATTSICLKTSLGERSCDNQFQIDVECAIILQTGIKRNGTARICPAQNNDVSGRIKKFFDTLTATGEMTSGCTKSLKWFVCSTIYPSCNSTELLYNVPCRTACEAIQNQVCSRAWENIKTMERNIFEGKLLLECSTLPELNSGICLYPSFLRDLLPQIDSNTSLKSKLVTYTSTISVVLFIFFIVVMVYVVRKKRKNNVVARTMSLHDVKAVHKNKCEEKIMHNASEVLGMSNPQHKSLTSLINLLGVTLFSKKNLEFDRNLGEGAFGKVVKCKTNILTSANVNMVAVKYLKENPEAEMENTFQRELEILSNFDHPNVIPLVGVCLDGPKCLILEFMKYGDLNEYIRLRSGSYHAVEGSDGNLPDGVEFQSPELSYHNLLYLTSQIADGISYLASKRFVHRDIATRNILVGENLRVKISDFGLAHDIYGSDYYRVNTQKMLPLRWLSPEALSLGKFTIYSDIFSFGVTMWEIFTYGMQPFYGRDNDEVCQRIRCHKLLERPYCCPQNIYSLMRVCWKFEPRQRKDCSFVRDTINTWLENEEPFIQQSWKRLTLAPLTERRPTILKSKKLHRIIKRDITL